MKRIRGAVLIFLSLFTAELYSQNQIEYRSDFGYVYPESPDEIVLTRNVVFTHKGMVMYCDSAVYNQKENYFFAYYNIHMYQDDTVHLTGDMLQYFGNDKTGMLSGNNNKVTLEDGDITMQTDYLLLDRNDNTVRYLSGADIWDKENTLTSKTGIYFIDDKYFNFVNQVEMTSKDGNMLTDTLFYYTKTKEAEFFGPTTILDNDSTKIEALQGKYNSKTEEFSSYSSANIYTKDKYMKADTVYYHKKDKNGYAYGQVYVQDTVNDMYLNCDSVVLQTVDTVSSAFITGRLTIRQVDGKDTLYFHSDTVNVIMDTSFDVKRIYAYKHCKFYREDMQGACEHAVYDRSDSSLTMTLRPVLWAEQAQLTSDTIIMYTDEKEVKTLYMQPNTFIVQNSDTNTEEFFNQVSGGNLIGYFNKNKLYYAEIYGNTKSIYFLWDENKKSKIKKLTGVNIGTSKNLHLYFKRGKLTKMSAIKDPEFFMDSYQNTDENERRLKGFIYSESDRPVTPYDIYVHRK
ncbi:MAG: hypothetical protein J6M30_05880 [Bacteroidales bacterium]|nr:hypothetical protein [Bacteroidales bacterium]